MDITGRIIQILEEQSGISARTGNPWKKKEWVLETFDQFPKKVKVQCFGDRADSINLEMNKDYILSIDIESREYNGRWYTDVNVFRAQEMQPTNQPPQNNSNQRNFSPQNQAPYPPAGGFGGGVDVQFTQVEEGEEDLPF